jgi:hypothetical protein
LPTLEDQLQVPSPALAADSAADQDKKPVAPTRQIDRRPASFCIGIAAGYVRRPTTIVGQAW